MFKKLTVIVLVTLMLLGSAVAFAAPPAQTDGEVYTVQAGDWLSKIAEKYYGDVLAYPLIVEATNARAQEDDSFAVIVNPDLIEVGQQLWIPVQEGMATTVETMSEEAMSEEAMTEEAMTEEAMAEEVAHEAPHWGYEGDIGPENWGELADAFIDCKEGQSQSPIDIANPAPAELANLVFDYQPSAVKILNNGHTIQVNYDVGSSLTVDGKTYNLLQFHFHAPSEHAITGELFPAEMHLVHQNAEDQSLAVVGVMLTAGAENSAFQPVWDNLPAEEVTEQMTEAQVNAADLLPAVQTTYRYSGSLTTPPCSEGVSWFVMTEPVELSAEQLAAFEAIYSGNNRPLQPLNDRDLVEDTSAE